MITETKKLVIMLERVIFDLTHGKELLSYSIRCKYLTHITIYMHNIEQWPNIF